MRRVAIDDSGPRAFSSDGIAVEPPAIDYDDYWSPAPLAPGDDGRPCEADYLDFDPVERGERFRAMLADQAETRRLNYRDRDVESMLEGLVPPDMLEQANLDTPGDRDARRAVLGASFRSGGPAPLMGRRPSASIEADAIREVLARHAEAAGLGLEELVRGFPPGRPSGPDTARRLVLAAAVRDARAAGANVQAIGDVIGRHPARVTELVRSAA